MKGHCLNSFNSFLQYSVFFKSGNCSKKVEIIWKLNSNENNRNGKSIEILKFAEIHDANGRKKHASMKSCSLSSLIVFSKVNILRQYAFLIFPALDVSNIAFPKSRILETFSKSVIKGDSENKAIRFI